MAVFYVSPEGLDDSCGSSEAPFRTLRRAQVAASPEVSNVTIYLSPGRYLQETPWLLNKQTFMMPTHVTYAAHPEQPGEVIISGAREITEWDTACSKDTWKAYIGDLDLRQLYVNNRRTAVASITELPSSWSRTSTGYIINDLVHWDSPAAVEFVYSGIYPWTEARCRVADMKHRSDNTTTITMCRPAWDHALNLYNYSWDGFDAHGPSIPTRLENSKSFLMQPGTFVCDRSVPGNHVLYYKPYPNQNPGSTVVTAPILEELLVLDQATDISFRGIMFCEATWLGPNASYLHYHGDNYYEGEGNLEKVHLGSDGSWLMVPKKTSKVNHCIELKNTSNILFDRCTFSKMGGVAVGSVGGCQGLTIQGCRFEDLSASAISLNESVNASIEDNIVQQIGIDYPGSPAIVLQNTSGCRVDHCQVSDTPHSGISLGPTFGSRISNNVISRTMTKLADGGGINLAGVQGESMQTGALVRGNIVIDTVTQYNFAIYADYGAKWVTVERNVACRADTPSVFEVHPPLQHVVFQDNIWDKEPTGLEQKPEQVIYRRNMVASDEQQLFKLAGAIWAEAGVRLDIVGNTQIGTFKERKEGVTAFDGKQV